MRAYTDETGNSGNNLFDANQPYFWTGTLVCERDLDLDGASVHADCLSIVGQNELHGNALGLSAIEKFARPLREFFLRQDCWFYFTRLEKNHLAGTKLFDTLMDSGINHAVSNLHYGVRGLRLPLAVQLIQILDDDDRRQFWDVYERADTGGFRDLLTRVKERLLVLHEGGIYHDRTVRLLTDAIDWGLVHPDPLLQGHRSELDSPNIVAFSLLLAMLHGLHESTGARVGTFVHDQQNQFARAMKATYDMLRKFTFGNSIVSTLLDFKEAPTFTCELQVTSSTESVGLQLIDVVLWLVKRFVESRGAVRGNCGDLVKAVISRGQISEFTLEAMQREVMGMIQVMEVTAPSEEQMKEGVKLMREIEARRLGRMNEPVR